MRKPKPKKKQRRALWLPVLAIIALVSLYALPRQQTPPTVKAQAMSQPNTLDELLALGPEQLGEVDLARMALLCAQGLRGSESLDVQQCLDTLDSWTAHVDRETKRNHHRFLEHPEDYHGSLGEYRMGMLITVLQQDLNVHYSPERAAAQREGRWEPYDVFNADSRDIFIHGLLSGNRSGTCASLPVLYAAIAQRLKYPVTLATTKTHMFVRYEENGSHLNVDGSGEGFTVYPDEHYKQWPFPVTDEEVKAFGFLRPRRQSEVLGDLLAKRALCLKSAKRYQEETQCWQLAARYLPQTPALTSVIQNAEARVQNEKDAKQFDECWKALAQAVIPNGPRSMYFKTWQSRLFRYMRLNTNMTEIEAELAAFNADLRQYQRERSDFPFTTTPQSIPLATLLTELEASPLVPPIRIERDAVPHEYQNGMPPELVKRISKLTTARDIVEEMHLFYAEEIQLFHLANQRRMQQGVYGSPPPDFSPRNDMRFKDLGISLPPAYDNYTGREKKVPLELQQRIAFRTQNVGADGRRRREVILTELRNYEFQERAQQQSIDIIRQRRQELDQIVPLHPPTKIQIVATKTMPNEQANAARASKP